MMPIFVHPANVAAWAENPSLFGMSYKSKLTKSRQFKLATWLPNSCKCIQSALQQ
jgi:hypothetical protein